MREHSHPMDLAAPTTGSLTDALVDNARLHPEQVVLTHRTDADVWAELTAAGLHDLVRDVAKGLVAEGVAAGDRVGLMARTRYEWTVVDYALWYVGAVTVPVYVTSAADLVRWVLSDSGSVGLVVETAAQRRLVEECGDLPDLRAVWTLDDPGGDGALAALTRAGADVADETLEERRAAVGPDDLATLIYTSGTTGRPKGCEVTHGRLMVEVAAGTHELAEVLEAEGATTLLFLPLAHVLARIAQVGAVQRRVLIGYCPDIATLLDDLQAVRPTFLLGVPRVFEKLFNSASQQAASDGRGRIFDRATEAAITYSRALQDGRVGPLLRTEHAFFDKFVYSRIRTVLGGRCRCAISGGAPLGDRLGHFFRGAGVPVIEGYGLTETTGAVTLGSLDDLHIGTVGRPLPGTAVRVDDDGELLVRGGQVITGYWREPAASAALLEDGWLRTGDLGEIDEAGFVRVTGRKKEVLVTAGGKQVLPAALEDRVRAHPLVSQCMVVGDGRPYVAALVTLDAEAVVEWARRRGLTSADPATLAQDPSVGAEVQAAVDDANATVSPAESIRRFAILPADWTEESGAVTPSLKLRRNQVMRLCRREIESLYD